MNDMSI